MWAPVICEHTHTHRETQTEEFVVKVSLKTGNNRKLDKEPAAKLISNFRNRSSVQIVVVLKSTGKKKKNFIRLFVQTLLQRLLNQTLALRSGKLFYFIII